MSLFQTVLWFVSGLLVGVFLVKALARTGLGQITIKAMGVCGDPECTRVHFEYTSPVLRGNVHLNATRPVKNMMLFLDDLSKMPVAERNAVYAIVEKSVAKREDVQEVKVLS